jgi:hypothetical protein
MARASVRTGRSRAMGCRGKSERRNGGAGPGGSPTWMAAGRASFLPQGSRWCRSAAAVVAAGAGEPGAGRLLPYRPACLRGMSGWLRPGLPRHAAECSAAGLHSGDLQRVSARSHHQSGWLERCRHLCGLALGRPDRPDRRACRVGGTLVTSFDIRDSLRTISLDRDFRQFLGAGLDLVLLRIDADTGEGGADP